MRCRKLLQFVEQGRGRTRTDPVLEYAKLSGCFYEFRVRMFDTALPYGPASLNTLSNTFLKLGKSEALTPEVLASQHAAIIVTDHSAVDYELVARHAPVVIDTRGVYRAPRANVVKA